MRARVLTVGHAALLLLATVALGDDAQQTIRVGAHAEEVLATKVTVSNLRRSYDFYTKAIGLNPVAMPGLPETALDDPEIAYADAKLNFSGSRADSFVILRKEKGVFPAPEHAAQTWLVIKTIDVRAAVARVRDMGLTVQVEPRDYMGAVVAVVLDPDGYSVELLQAAPFNPSTGD